MILAACMYCTNSYPSQFTLDPKTTTESSFIQSGVDKVSCLLFTHERLSTRRFPNQARYCAIFSVFPRYSYHLPKSQRQNGRAILFSFSSLPFLFGEFVWERCPNARRCCTVYIYIQQHILLSPEHRRKGQTKVNSDLSYICLFVCRSPVPGERCT